LGGAGSGSGDLVTTLLAPTGSASMTAASSASLTSALERHGNHVRSAAFLVVGGILSLVAIAAAAVITIFILLVQGYGCGSKFSTRVVISGGVSTCNADHVIQGQIVFIDQASKLVPEQSSPLQATYEGVHSCAVIHVLALVPGC
jgi:hypothetical protein